MTERTLNEGTLSEWINRETGEIRYVREIDIKTTDKDFDKVWIALMMSALDVIGNKKIEILSYLVNNRNRSDNVIFATQDAISEATGVSKKTVNVTISELKKAKLISQVCPGAYRLSPGIVWRGSHFARMAIMAKFDQEQKAAETPARASEPPNTEQATLPGVSVPPRASQEPLAAGERVESPFYEDDSHIFGPAEVAEYNSHL